VGNTMICSVLSKKYASRYLVLIIVFLSLALRFGASLFLVGLDDSPQGDGLVFTRIAWNLVSGSGYSANGEVPTAWRPPGYPILLAGLFSIFGQSWVAARIVNLLISSLTVGMIYLISCELFNKNIGLVAALISAFYPPFIRYSVQIVSDTLFVLMMCLVLFIFNRIYDRPNSLGTRLICGVLLGVATLIRAELLLFIPCLFIWAFLAYRRFHTALRTVVIILLPVLLLVLPWIIRNYIVFDELVMATNLGHVMWGVHNPDTFTDENLMGGWYPPDPHIRNAGEVPYDSRNPAYRYLPELEWNQRQIQLALVSIKQNVQRLPRMGIYKLHRLIFTPGSIRNLARAPVLYCFCFGLVLLLSSGDKRFLILYMFILYAVGSTLVFYMNERLRMVIDPTFIMIASYGLSEQIKLVKRKRKLLRYNGTPIPI
jgi:4-amino-4-deoxy-L-arabinose transferase-like glycosyltransferase